MSVYVVGIFDKVPENAIVINTTSRSSDKWSQELSPFLLGPVNLYNGYVSQNVENAWQYSKCYKQHIDFNGNPTSDYFDWAVKGWNKKFADRYPMGKGAKPEYSYWNGKKLGYIEARKRIYIPLYFSMVIKTPAYERLKQMCLKDNDIYLRCFDGYNHKKLLMSYKDVVNNAERPMGHSFVLAMMLEKEIKHE